MHPVALADVLAGDVVGVVQRGHRDRSSPPTNTGSSMANGVTAPVRPTFTAICFSSVVFCSAGNLNAIAQRGNLLVVPSARRRSSASTLITTPSVSKSSVAPLLGPFARRTRRASSMPEQRRQCGSTGSPQARSSSVSQRRRRASAGRLRSPTELIGEGPQAALRHQRWDRGCAACRPRRCAGSRTAARPPPRAPRSCFSNAVRGR